MKELSFFVPGIPIPQGSKTRTKWGGMREDNPNTQPWREAVIWSAKQKLIDRGGAQFPVPVVLEASFVFPRLKSHYRANGEIKDSAPIFKTSTPDLDKLVRAVCDAITGSGLWRDDSVVVGLLCSKRYGTEPGVQIILHDVDGMVGEFLEAISAREVVA